MELVVGIIHLVGSEDGFQTTLIKRLIVRYQRKSFNQGFYLLPYLREDGSILRITLREPVNTGTTIFVVIGIWLNERVETIYYLSTTYNYNTYGANRTALIVGCLEIYRCEILYLYIVSGGSSIGGPKSGVVVATLLLGKLILARILVV